MTLQPNLDPEAIRSKRFSLGFVFFLFVLPYLIMATFGAIEPRVPSLLACMGFAFVVYWIACVEGKFSFSQSQILMLGLTLRVCLMPMPACDDMYRYLWEGKIIGLGYSPFRLAPNAPELIALRDSTWSLINHPDLPTLYPIFSEAVFALLAWISKTEWFFKAAFVAFDVGGFLVLRKLLRNTSGTHPEASLRIQAIYFLNPLLILEIAGRGHLDSIIVFFNLVFIWALQAKKLGAPISLIFGALSKINSLALAPLLFLQMSWKRALAWSVLIAMVITVSLFATGMMDTLGRFTTKFSYNNIMPYLIEQALPFLSAKSHRLIGGILLGFSGLFLLWRLRKASIAEQALGFMGLLLIFSPTFHTWYLLWILPFAALTRSRPWLLCSGTILLGYLVYDQAYRTGHWQEIPWLRLPEFLPPLILWLYLNRKDWKLKF